MFLYPVFLSYILYPFYLFTFLFFLFSSQFSFLSFQIPFLFFPSFPSSVINSPACYDIQKICNPLPPFLFISLFSSPFSSPYLPFFLLYPRISLILSFFAFVQPSFHSFLFSRFHPHQSGELTTTPAPVIISDVPIKITQRNSHIP